MVDDSYYLPQMLEKPVVMTSKYTRRRGVRNLFLIILCVVIASVFVYLYPSNDLIIVEPDEALPRNKMVFVTFATKSMVPFVKNWALNARLVGLKPLLVAAIDEDVAMAATSMGVDIARLYEEHVVGDKYINTHSPLFRHMGLRKVVFVRKMINRGNTVVLTDADVTWLGDPTALFKSNGLNAADILVSTDCINVEADKAGAGGSLCNTLVNYNTGVIVVRPTPGAKAFITLWMSKIEEGISNNIVWMRDQPCFNMVARDGLPNNEPPVANPKRPQTDRVLLSVAGGKTVLGVLSPESFAGGHVFFVQGFRKNALAVHATHQYGDHESFAYGKRMRFRQFGLWKGEQREYTEGKYLRITEMPYETVEESADALETSRALLRVFFETDALWRRRVRDGIALARALGRTLVLPKAYCYCDRSWSPLKRCRLQEVPGMKMPFECPLDHIINSNVWERNIPFRGPEFVRKSEKTFKLTQMMTDTAFAAHVAPWAHLDVIEVTLDAPLCGLNRNLVVPNHPVRNVSTNFFGFTNYLLDQRIAFCEYTQKVPLPNATGGMVSKHCGTEEETGLYGNPRRGDIGYVRAKTNCLCEIGFRLPEKLVITDGNACP